MARDITTLATNSCMKLYDYVYMIGYDEDGERFKFAGSPFAYKSFIIKLAELLSFVVDLKRLDLFSCQFYPLYLHSN